MKQWVVLCMLASVTFSGCLGFLDDDATTDADPDAMDGMGGNETVNATNTAPAVDFTANRTEGEVPFDVRFDFNASDADGDNLTWTLDADGDGAVDSSGTGAVLPFNFTFTYDVAGMYNATLNVTDGTNATVSVVSINATEPEESEGEGEEDGAQFPVVLEGSVEVLHPTFWVTGSRTCASFATGVGGVDCDFFAIEDAWQGHAFTSDGAGDVDLEFRTDCAPTGESVQVFGNDGHESGKVPEGAGCVVVADFLAPGSFTVTIN